jgi:K+-sensing histidine kinase KdpD
MIHVSVLSSPLWRDRYRFAFLTVTIATGCVGLLMLLISLPIFLIYIVAITASTHYGGVRTGLVAVALAFFASIFLFLPPYFSWTNERSVWPLLGVYCSTVVLSYLWRARYRAVGGHCRGAYEADLP